MRKLRELLLKNIIYAIFLNFTYYCKKLKFTISLLNLALSLNNYSIEDSQLERASEIASICFSRA